MSNLNRGSSIDASDLQFTCTAQQIKSEIGSDGVCGFFSSIFFLAHLAFGKVSFCHHLASVIRRPLTFHILIFSSKTPQTN
jgi:hypothetical protein